MHAYLDLIIHWSAKQNLVSGHDLPHLVERHFLPSLFLDTCLSENLTGDLMDLGSGAGFPGVLIAIMRPALAVTLLDASRKKTLFLEEVCAQLTLNCRVVCERCEIYAQTTDQKYQTVVARAVARTDKLLIWTRLLQGKGDVLFAMKGGDEKGAAAGGFSGGSSAILRPGASWTAFSDFMRHKYILRVER
jgi:16S rRNA (guanine527-N7)-methyltransferase